MRRLGFETRAIRDVLAYAVKYQILPGVFKHLCQDQHTAGQRMLGSTGETRYQSGPESEMGLR